jgi:hypothetical protein
VRQENVIPAPEVCLWLFGVIDRTGNEGIVLALERLRRISALLWMFAGCKPLAALRAFDLLRVDAANSVGRDRVSAVCADRVEGRHNFFEIDFLLLGTPDCLTSAKLRRVRERCRKSLQCCKNIHLDETQPRKQTCAWQSDSFPHV